jgi:hypothetical protein
MSGGGRPHGFLTQAGGAVRFDRESRSYVPDRLPEGVRVAGAPQGSAACVPARCASAGGKQFVCFCEDVTTKDISLSVKEGFSSLELSKRYTTVMGWAHVPNSGLVTPTSRARPRRPAGRRSPHAATTPPASLLAARAAGEAHVHHWHAEHGGKMPGGGWKRPMTTATATARSTVHESLG